MSNYVFLTARWEYLLMANYAVDPEVLRPLTPYGAEIDLWQGRAYASLVGFLFLDTRVLGLPVPYHRNFEEVNLRFYVRYKAGNEWRRGVVFVREIVPRQAIALVANLLYGESYIRLPMRHYIDRQPDGLHVAYRWKHRGDWHHLAAVAALESHPLEPGSEAAFITEHYWGYTRRGVRRTSAYEVVHPAWRIHPVEEFDVRCDFKALYGPAFEPFLRAEPESVFLAEGSPVIVRGGRMIID